MSDQQPKAGLRTWLSDFITLFIGPNREGLKEDEEFDDDHPPPDHPWSTIISTLGLAALFIWVLSVTMPRG